MDDSNAFQEALDNGTTVYFPSLDNFANPTTYQIDADIITVRPEIRHINFFMNTIQAVDGDEVLLLEGGSLTDTLVIEQGQFELNIVHNDSRVLIIKDMSSAKPSYYQSDQNGTSGDVFIENTKMNAFDFNQQDVWARQFNPEGDNDKELIRNNGGNLWVLGLKSEISNGLLNTTNGGKSELFSTWFLGYPREDISIFKAQNSELSIVGVQEKIDAISGPAYETWVRQNLGNDTTELKKYDLDGADDTGYNMSAYFGHLNTSNINEPPQIRLESEVFSTLVGTPISPLVSILDDGLPNNTCDLNPFWEILSGPINGNFSLLNEGPSIKTLRISFDTPGTYDLRLSASDGEASVNKTITVHVYENAISTASGNGADAMIYNATPDQNYGASPSIVAPLQYGGYKTYLRFDISNIAKPITAAQLNLNIVNSINVPLKGGEIEVYGLNHNAPNQFWLEGSEDGSMPSDAAITYNNALNYGNALGLQEVDPATTTYLGEFDSTESEVFRLDQFHLFNAALTAFLNSDDDGFVTLILVRKSGGFGSLILNYATKENCEHPAPRLFINSINTDPCIGFGISNVCPSDYTATNYGSANPVLIGGTAPFTYEWSNNSAFPNGLNLIPGTYTVTITDANGCIATETIDIGFASNGSCNGDFIPYEFPYLSNVVNGEGLHLNYQEYIHARNGILMGANATYTAGNFIQLDAGFEVQENVEFHAYIEPCNDCLYRDSLALLALYHASNGANWTNTWDLNQPINSWYGITTNANGCVTSINLTNNQLSGNLPAELGNLSELIELRLSLNNLSGSIPPELGNLSQLTNLWLNRNFTLSSSIPPELGNLTNLTHLDLGNNALTGSIPLELAYLTNLTYIEIDNNLLSGTIPSELGNLIQLTHLELDDNNLSGSLPTTLANLTNLQTLDLSGNNLSGCFPTEYSALCTIPIRSFLNNPNLPGGGDFDAFCANNVGACN